MKQGHKMTYNEIKEILQGGICNVRFTKVDGSSRILRCTLNSNYIPRGDANDKEPIKRRRTPEYVSENVLAVWDLDALQWKSFRVNLVEKVDVLQALKGG